MFSQGKFSKVCLPLCGAGFGKIVREQPAALNPRAQKMLTILKELWYIQAYAGPVSHDSDRSIVS
jgi:hypothetical protein